MLLPVIDMAKFEDEKKKLMAALEGPGCFRVINHGIPQKVMEDVKSSVRCLFDLPSEVKQCNTNAIIGSGYVKPSMLRPCYEGFGVFDASSAAAMDVFCSQLDVSSSDREILSTFAAKLHDLIVDLALKVAKVLGIVGCSFQDWSCHLRMNKFNYTEETIGSCGVEVHTDHSFITVILEDETNPGLEIMDSFGNFIAVDPVPGTFFVNVGDIGKVWSNGRLNSVWHRVLCKKSEPRITIPLFLLAPKDNKIEPQAELIDSQHPQKYQSFDYMEYRKTRFSTISNAGDVLHHWAINEHTPTS